MLPSLLLAALLISDPTVDLAKVKIVDLTYAFDANTLYWPTSPSGFELEQLSHGKTKGGFFYAANRFCAPEHGGTHLDAPIHFAEKGWTAEAIPMDRFIGPAIVLDVKSKASAERDYRLRVEDVVEAEKKLGRIPDGAIILLRTGWGAKYSDRKAYFGDDKKGDASNLHFPSYGREAVALLIKDRKVIALGVDTPSIDHGPSRDFPVHQLAAAANVLGLENVAHLDEVPEKGAVVIALPLKIKGGSGGPLRMIALVPR